MKPSKQLSIRIKKKIVKSKFYSIDVSKKKTERIGIVPLDDEYFFKSNV